MNSLYKAGVGQESEVSRETAITFGLLLSLLAGVILFSMQKR